jgi:transposase
VTVNKECESEILRLVQAEKWPEGTVASELGVHHDVVTRVLAQDASGQPAREPRPSKLDAYKGFILEQLERYPRLRATRLRMMVAERGFRGSAKIVERFVKGVRPRAASKAYLVCERLPGEQGQVDWGHVGQLSVMGGMRALWVFVMLLAYSRMRYAELVLDMTAESLRRSILRALTSFGGVPRQLLFDNPKIVVLERHGRAARLHSGLIELAGQLRVKPVLARVRTPEDKGGVERAIRELKEGFFAGRSIPNLEIGNLGLRRHIETVVMPRRHPTLAGRSVGEVFAEEKERLMPLPNPMPTADLVLPVAVDKTASVRLGTNRYSVPPTYASATLTLVADDDHVRLLDGDQEVARHARSWGRGQRIDDPAHRRALCEGRPRAEAITIRDQLLAAVPALSGLYERWVEQGRNINFMTGHTRKLFALYGPEIFGYAVRVMGERGTHDLGALALLCEQERQRTDRPMPVDVVLGAHVVDAVVVPHDLGSYDRKRGES